MHNSRFLKHSMIASMLMLLGCQATQRVGRGIGNAALEVPFLIVDGLIDGIGGSDDPPDPKANQSPQKLHWIDHPDANRTLPFDSLTNGR